MQVIDFFNKKPNLVATIILLLALSIFLFVWFFGVNILYLDEWSFASLVKKAQEGSLSASLLFEAHNEHRLVFPKLLYLLLVPISNMNSVFIMHINALIICAEFICLFLVAQKQFGFSYSKIPVWLLIIPLFVFNFRQWQNLVWAFQLAFYMVLIFAVLSLFFIEKSTQKEEGKSKYGLFTLAVLFAIIATFSSAMGFLVWIAGIVQLGIHWFSSKQKKILLFLTTWALVGAFSFILYNIGLNSGIKEELLYAVFHPLPFLKFFFALISLTSVHSLSIIAIPIGVAVFAIFIFGVYKAFINKRLKENSFWIALSLFSLLFSVLTTVGRFQVAFEYTDRSRYTIFSALLLIGAFMLLYDNYRISNKKGEIRLFHYTFYVLFLLAIELNMIGLAFGYKQKKDKEEIRKIVLNYKQQPISKLKTFDPWLSDQFISIVEELIPFVEEHKYNAFKNKKSE